ncbi:hypothetical protein OsJ_36313 [Oryza sativa Japonica Group]|uniref:Uncharacterized protein n=1 Tax=Oryza sativa subsp. japonica TaxID=39947 RepID=B9GDG0_ORYSJ|nr:hypothetical protein OsJ_36313 [Oryza sativa Japonica Group]
MEAVALLHRTSTTSRDYRIRNYQKELDRGTAGVRRYDRTRERVLGLGGPVRARWPNAPRDGPGVTMLGALDAATVALLEALDQLDVATAMRYFRYLERRGAGGTLRQQVGNVVDFRWCGVEEGTRRQDERTVYLEFWI